MVTSNGIDSRFDKSRYHVKEVDFRPSSLLSYVSFRDFATMTVIIF